MSYLLNENQVHHLQALAEAGEYGLAYRFCAEMLDEAVAQDDVGRGTQRWFEWAQQINDNPQSLSHRYARTFSQMSASGDGFALSAEDFKEASDVIAAQVIEHITTTGVIPADAQDIVINDIMSGSNVMGTDPEDFPGTLTAYALFGVDANGIMIWENQDMSFLEKLEASGEQALKHGGILGAIVLHGVRSSFEGAGEVVVDPSRLLDVPDAIKNIVTYEPLQDTAGALVLGSDYKL